MEPGSEGNRNSAFDAGRGARNPFGVMDVPDPNGQEVAEFAAGAKLEGSADDANATLWGAAGHREPYGGIEGRWSSRWNGGADSTIPGDAKNKWKEGQAELRMDGERVFILFDWSHQARRGLIDARREGAERLVGKYINLSDPTITRPWIGLIVNTQRIDGRWSGGRLDFRR